MFETRYGASNLPSSPLSLSDDKEESVPYFDPNVNNLVEMVSCKAPKTYKTDSGNTKAKIVAVDVGMVGANTLDTSCQCSNELVAFIHTYTYTCIW